MDVRNGNPNGHEHRGELEHLCHGSQTQAVGDETDMVEWVSQCDSQAESLKTCIISAQGPGARWSSSDPLIRQIWWILPISLKSVSDVRVFPIFHLIWVELSRNFMKQKRFRCILCLFSQKHHSRACAGAIQRYWDKDCPDCPDLAQGSPKGEDSQSIFRNIEGSWILTSICHSVVRN